MKHFEISDNLKNDILVNLVEPQYKSEIIRNLKLRKRFKTSGLCFETFSKFFVGLSSVMSFASGIYKYEIMTFLAGTTSVVSLVMLQYAGFSYRESKKLGIELNEVLKKLNITQLNLDTGSITDSLDIEQPSTPLNKN